MKTSWVLLFTYLITAFFSANTFAADNARTPKIPYHDLQSENLNGERLKEWLSNRDAQIKRVNIVRMVAHVGDAAVDWITLGETLRYGGVLDPVLREIAIVRVGLRAESEYEVFYHDYYLKNLGVKDDKIQAIRIGAESDQFSRAEKAVLRLTDTILDKYKPSDEDFQFLLNELGMQALHELIFNIGYYMMTVVYMETFKVEVEDPPLYVK